MRSSRDSSHKRSLLNIIIYKHIDDSKNGYRILKNQDKDTDIPQYSRRGPKNVFVTNFRISQPRLLLYNSNKAF